MDLGLDSTRPVFFLSMGAGQDSTALLYRYVYSATFREQFGRDRQLVVIFCATLDEHHETDEHVEHLKRFCAIWNIPFWHITPDTGYYVGAWKGGLIAQYRAHNTVGLPGRFSRACTDNLKTAVFYKGVNDLLGHTYGFGTYRKGALYAYTARFGEPIEVWIGFSRGEESRASGVTKDESQLDFGFAENAPDCNSAPIRDPWFTRNIELRYPLIEVGMNREDCQNYIRSLGMDVPRPSACRRCHFKSRWEIYHLYLTDPNAYFEWVELEANKILHWAGRAGPNSHVFKDKSLPTVLRETIAELAHLSDEQRMAFLNDYVMNHGCTKNAW